MKYILTIVLCGFIFAHNPYISEAPKPPLTPKQMLVKGIMEKFPEQPEIMVAIAIQESQLDPNAMGYNCWYKGYWKGNTPIITGSALPKKETGVISWSCRKGDEKKAWSKDGGVFQINKPTKEQLTVEGNLTEARNKYEKQGLHAWTAYSKGYYKTSIKEARKLIAEIV